VARHLCWRLERTFELIPADESMAIAVRLDLDSVVRAKRTSYLAYVPQAARRGDERLPVLYLLHGADGSWTDFSERATRRCRPWPLSTAW